MMRKVKRALTVLLVMTSLLTLLTGCGKTKTKRYQAYVETLITANYLGVSDEYVQTTGVNEADAEAMYLQNATRLASNLEDYYGLDIRMDKELAPAMEELAKKIYSKTKFEVGKAYQDNGIYYVDVTIQPIDILNQTYAEVTKYVQDFNDRVAKGEFNNYTKEEYENVFAKGIIEILNKAADNMQYKEKEKVTVRIIEGDSSFSIKNEDFQNIDMKVIAATDEYDKASGTDAE